MEQLLGKNSKLATHVRKLLSSGQYRRECSQYVCEGTKLLFDAAKSGVDIVCVIHTPGTELPELESKVEVRAASEELLKSLSTQKTPQGAIFICNMKQSPKETDGGFRIILDGVQDPGNVGTVLRTAEAFGVSEVLLAPGCADPYLYKTARASMGSVFRQSFSSLTHEELKELKEKKNLIYVAADSGGDATFDDIPWDNCAVIIGSEGRGPSKEMLSVSDRVLSIPMQGSCESLNAAIAATVVMWEYIRRKTEGR